MKISENLTAHQLKDMYGERYDRANELNGKESLSESEIREVRQLKNEMDKLTVAIDEREHHERNLSKKAMKTFSLDEETANSREFRQHLNRVEGNEMKGAGGLLADRLLTVDGNRRAITSTSGSAMIPTEYIKGTIFDSLSINPLRDLGVQYMFNEEGSQWPRITAYPTVDWVASQGDQISLDSAMTIGSVKTNHKDLAVRMRIQRQVLLDGVGGPANILETAAQMAINDAVLDAIFHADGTGGKPTGLDSLSGTNTVAGGSVVLGDYAEIRAGVYQLMKDNVPLENIGMVAHPVIWLQLSGLEDTTNQPLRKPMGIDTMPMRFTSAADINQGGGADTTIYLGDWSKLMVSFQGPYIFYTDNAADRLQMEIILWMRVDFNFLQEDHFCLIQNVASGSTT